MARVFACAAGLPPAEVPGLRRALTAGELLLYPTDTLYAIGGLVFDPRAARRVREAKGRGAGKALPVVAADVEQVRGLCARVSAGAWALARAFWPGPLTLVLPASPQVPDEVAGDRTVAVRVPAHVVARELCDLAGPLVSTSANRSGAPPPLTCEEAVAALGGAAAFALDAGPGTARASTIVNATGDSPVLVRAGAVAWEDVLRAWP